MSDTPVPDDIGDAVSVRIPLLLVAPVGAALLPTLLFGLLEGQALVLGGIALGIAVAALGVFGGRASAKLAGFVLVVVSILVFWSPLIQTLLYGIIFQNPAFWYWGGIGGLLVVAGYLLRFRGRPAQGGVLVSLGIGVAVVMGVIVGPTFAGFYTSERLADRTLEEANSVDSLTDIDRDQPRIAPLDVSETRATNSLQYSRYRIQNCDITNLNRTLHWSCALSPDGVFNSLTENQIGAVYINQSTARKDITVRDNASFQAGIGMGVTDNLYWQLSRSDFWADYRDPFVVPSESGPKLVIPYVEHEIEYRLTPIPQPYSVPEFGGVKIVSEDGSIEDVPADRVSEYPLLNDANGEQNVYPYGLARQEIQAVSFQNGWLNTFVGHRDQIELSDTPGDGNRQPFVIQTEDGLEYIVSAEPWGDANGVISVWTIDAQNGEKQVRRYSTDSALRGPRKAVNAIMASPDLARLNNVKPVEPIPVTLDGNLYWQVRVVPNSSSSITYIGFFNARTEAVTLVQTSADVRAFLDGRIAEGQSVSPESDLPGQTQPDRQPRNATDDDALTIVVVRDDGTRQNITVDEGSTIRIVEGNRTGSEGNRTGS